MENNATEKNSNKTLMFFRKWWKTMLIVFAIALIGSTVGAFLIKPMYKSTAVMFPTSSNRLSKAILGDRYTYDFLDYGDEENCEYAIEVLSSQTMRDTVCSRFNLLTHYAIPEDYAHKYFKLNKMYKSNVTIRRTDYLGVEISVMDSDPQWAADIANFIAMYYDTICAQVQHERALNAYQLMEGTCEELRESIAQLEDSIKSNPKYAASARLLMEEKCGELASLETHMAHTKVDMSTPISQKFMLDQASAADKKAYPKRLAIIAAGTASALILCILVLLVLEYVKNDDIRIRSDE